MKKKLIFGALACAIALMSSGYTLAQTSATLTGDVRVTGDLDELPGGGNAGDENGGNTNLTIGINAGNVQNWALMGFDTTPAAGQTVTGATLTISVATGFDGGAQHGSAADSFSLHELYATNAGWIQSSGFIQNNTSNIHTAGGVTFQNQADFNDASQDVQWRDAAGANIDNIIGAFDGVTSVGSSVNGWLREDVPDEIVFDIDAATAQQWVDDGAIDLVLQVTDGDGNSASRFNLVQNSADLVFLAPAVILGDVDLSGDVSFLDIAPFIMLLSSNGFQLEADIDGNGEVTFLDIAPFIEILSGGGGGTT